mmetsp:Transcript_113549/g.253321  ORF Transcript_113549/g.253321 Transcript_113549/m.253321 type:complete len:199 (+) Transcript_113549:75-671(+)
MSKSGTVKFFNDDKGFGFIVQDDGGEDLFAHRNQCVDGQSLVEGDVVRYDVGWDDRKGKSNADNITGGSGGEGGKGGFGNGKGSFRGDKGGFGGGKGGFDAGKGYKGSAGGGDGRSIYVSGFDFGADEAALQEHFSGMGTIAALNFQGQGAALITYVEADAAQRAVRELDRTTMSGHNRYCSVKMDGERKGKGKGKKF